MNLNQLIYFQRVAELEHFTKAAEELFVSQPGLTKAIQNLEKELDTLLFEHSGRNVQLTEQGKLFYFHVSKAIKELDEGVKSLNLYGVKETAQIDLGCIPPLVSYFLPDCINRYTQSMVNQTAFTLRQFNTPELIKSLKRNEITMAISSEHHDDLLEIEPILQQDFIVIVHKEHPLASYEELSFFDLVSYSVVGYHEDIVINKKMKQLEKEQGIPLEVDFFTDGELSVVSMVEQGIGVGIVTNSPALNYYHIAKIPLKTKIHNTLYLTYRKDTTFSLEQQQFIQYLRMEAQTIFQRCLTHE